MKCLVLKQFHRWGELQLPGSITDVPKDMLVKMAEYVQPLEALTMTNIDVEEDTSYIKADSNAAYVSVVNEPSGFCHKKSFCYVLQEADSEVHPYGCIEDECHYYSEKRTCRNV